MANLTVPLLADSAGSKFGVLVNSADGTPKYWRARATSGDYGGAEVLLYDVAGNPIFTAAAAMADTFANPTVGRIGTLPSLFTSGGTWARARDALALDGQTYANGAGGAPAIPLLNDGANWRVGRSARGIGDGTAGDFPPAAMMAWNASNFDRVQGASATNYAKAGSPPSWTGSYQNGALFVLEPGQWAMNSNVAANTQASVTRAAGGAGVRHVLRTLVAVVFTTSTAGSDVVVIVRDGASGVGTVLWQLYVPWPGVAGQASPIVVTGLALAGSVNTAMTVEFNVAGGPNVIEGVAATGVDVN